MRRALALTTAAVLTLAAGAVWAAHASSPSFVAAALANPNRGDDKNLDDKRKPLEVVTFTGVKRGDKVADLIPGHGYWGEIFADIVGPKGHVYEVWPKEYENEDKDDAAATEALVKKPDFANMSVLHETAADFSAPEKLDLVFTAQNYHDYPDKFMGPTDTALLNKAVFAALKPGGTYLIIDHVAQAGSALRDTDTLHRIDPATVKTEVTAAGFKFVGESKLLVNPVDDHTKKVFDKSIQGHTDQFIYKFRKPG